MSDDGRDDRDTALQAAADAAWEGLSSDEQDMLRATGATGEALDRLVVEYRDRANRSSAEPHTAQGNSSL